MKAPNTIRITVRVDELRAAIKTPKVQFMPAAVKFTDQGGRDPIEYTYGRPNVKEKNGIITLRFEKI